jgi:dTDP-4-amino-4,6-dideoxygalactose transaminase
LPYLSIGQKLFKQAWFWYNRHMENKYHCGDSRTGQAGMAGAPAMPSIPYARQWISDDDIAAVVETLRSDFLTTGPKIAEFEDALKAAVGAKYAVALCNGTAALHAACFAAGIGPGDEAIVPPMTFAASANCVLYQGGRPVFCDIDPVSWNIDPGKIEGCVTDRTKAIIPVHYAGLPCDMDAIMDIAQRRGLAVIEDAAHAIGATYGGRPVGSIGSMACFSFHPVKQITAGEGGAVTTDDEALYRKLLLFRSHGITRDAGGALQFQPARPAAPNFGDARQSAPVPGACLPLRPSAPERPEQPKRPEPPARPESAARPPELQSAPTPAARQTESPGSAARPPEAPERPDRLVQPGQLLQSEQLVQPWQPGQSDRPGQPAPAAWPPWYYEQQCLGYNYRLSDIHAALGISQLKKLGRFIARRRQIAEAYRGAFSGLCESGAMSLQGIPEKSGHAWHLFVARLDAARRDGVYSALRQRGIGANLHYIPVYLHPHYRRLGYPQGLCPVAESLYAGLVTLPLFPMMSDSDVDRVIEFVRECVSAR